MRRGPRDKTRARNTSLSALVFATLFCFTIIVALAVSALLAAVSFASYEAEARADLEREALHAAQRLDGLTVDEQIEQLSGQMDDSVRFTLVAPDGSVLFESIGSKMPAQSHADRPEVIGAIDDGTSSVVRFSDTLQTDTIYAAARLSDASVVRLSETRGSLFAFMGPVMPPLLLTLAGIVLLLAIISRRLTRWIIRPLEGLATSSTATQEAYAEVLPIIKRIDEQRGQLKAQNEELQRAEHMRRDFSANVSHELKTPLHVISGYAELMAAGEIPGEKTTECAKLIYDEAQGMRTLIDDVLVLSRIDEPVMQAASRADVDLLEIARLTAEKLACLARQAQVDMSVDGQHCTICADAALLEQMVRNLMSNAIRYNKPKGAVSVMVLAHEDAIELKVSDSGIGIPEADQDKVFERFYRVDKSRSRETGGTGLGLAIAKHAAAAHGGTITVQSSLGKGSTFTVTLPRVAES